MDTTFNIHCDPTKFHVLAVDDSTVDRKLIEKLLRISFFKVTVVDSGNKAFQVLGLDNESTSDLKVDLIMTDYSMPEMTGFELLKKIKNSSTLREIPVVIMSSENIQTRIRRCLDEGAQEFIMKPVKLSDLQRLKNSILKTGSNLQELVKENINPVKTHHPDPVIMTEPHLHPLHRNKRKQSELPYTLLNQKPERVNLPKSAGRKIQSVKCKQVKKMKKDVIQN